MEHYDLAVIGTGSGNSILDERFADQRVALVERGVFGGTCLNVGCIPTKMFVYPADLARETEHATRLGVSESVEDVRWPEIRDRIFGRIDPISEAGKDYRLSLPNVDLYQGECRFVGDRTLRIGNETFDADQIVIAAGSRATVPDIPGLAGVRHHTSDTVMRLEELPRRVAILGGGFVAAEFAHVFSAYGVQVTQIHRGPTLLRKEDEEVAARFTELASRQWGLRLNTEVNRVWPVGEGIGMELSDGTALEVDVLLLATGRVPNSDLLNLPATGVATDSGGVIEVDQFQHTTAPGIWALGDIANHYQLKHVANLEARVVQHNLMHPEEPRSSDHRFVPSAVFTSPQVASVGLTSQEARARGIAHITAVQPYAGVAYGWAMEDTDHFVKLVADQDGQRLLGAHVIGPQASLLVQIPLQAMSLDEPVERVASGQYWIHPALTEVVENALLKLVSVAASAPDAG
ncbi:MAG: mycothione reductase [Actinomycetota bacterium]|nr:mycothione reductase [Actinomycetota bacterium]